MRSETGLVPTLLRQRHLGYAQCRAGSDRSTRGGRGKDESRKSQETQRILVISKLEKFQKDETSLDSANFCT